MELSLKRIKVLPSSPLSFGREEKIKGMGNQFRSAMLVIYEAITPN